jgi:DNA-directed RNA polymerase subunit beta
LKEYYNVKNYARVPDVAELPPLIEIQSTAFDWFIQEGLLELFDEINPIESFNGGDLKLYLPSNSPRAKLPVQPKDDLDDRSSKNAFLEVRGENGLKYWFEPPKYNTEMCIERDMNFAAPLYVQMALVNEALGGRITIQSIFLGDFPLMTDKGTFIINGSERVVVSQLIRSPGVYFDAEEDRATGRMLSNAKLIPDRGAWMEFETRKNDYIALKFNRKRTVPISLFFRALAAVSDGVSTPEIYPVVNGLDEEILALFAGIDDHPNHKFIENAIKQEPNLELKRGQNMAEAALIEFYRRMRPGDPPTLDNAKEYLESQLFDQRRYDLERVGRYKLNQRLNLDHKISRSNRTISKADIVAVVTRMIDINNARAQRDDIDHLGNRRVKTVGELIMNKLRIGLRRMERVVKERMSTRETTDYLSPITLVNIRPIVAAVREFFGSSQLSQFMEQTNPLTELTHKRTLSALGPGGLRRERAGFDVRDVHHSHYGRICPIETPEGPNIGLIGRLASYARVNEFGFVETPYRKVAKSLPIDSDSLLGRRVSENIEDAKGKTIIAEEIMLTADHINAMKKLGLEEVPVVPFVLPEITYFSADQEDHYIIAQANSRLNDLNEFVSDRVAVRYKQAFRVEPAQKVDYIDIAPRQIVGISAALIPFLEHDDASRALMGSNMQRQAVPLLKPDVAVVSTGMEDQAAYDSGQVLVSDVSGEVTSVQGDRIVIRTDDNGERRYKLRKYDRSNQSTCIDQRPIVIKGQRVKRGDVIADSSSTYKGNLALGHDVLAAFICWDGGNYEDALLISEDMLRNDKFTSIHIEKHEIEARDTKLGPEEITYDIPNVGEDALKDLDEYGVIRIGAEVGPNDILVGKITPKGEKELSPEEKLLRAIFGEQAREVKDSSLRLPHGDRGKVVDVKTLTRDEHPDLPAGVEKMVRVSIAQRRKLMVGDKMAGRHGNKGVISRIVSIEDMPYLEDGRSVEIILNPTGVPGRMNIGQVLELHLGWAADRLGFRAVTPVFDGADEDEIQADLGRAWMLDEAWHIITERAWEWVSEQYDPEDLKDDEEVTRLYTVAWLGENPEYDRERLYQEPVYTRRAVLREYLREVGVNPDAVLLFDNDHVKLSERARADQEAINVSLRWWIATHAPEMQVPDKISHKELYEYANKVMFQTGEPVPQYGKHKLYDGRTGDQFDNHVAVGLVHMLKLAHLVEDKAHARSTGPYSLVTQQPLGGKAQFGGQRFGEMEVWALEAYGAAHTLQEMLTVKSDDVQGRVATYESIVKGEKIKDPGIPTGFRVLVKELQSLGLAVEVITESGDTIRFGKEDENNKRAQPDTGLMSLNTNNNFATTKPSRDRDDDDFEID